jgi:hypothetical protein
MMYRAVKRAEAWVIQHVTALHPAHEAAMTDRGFATIADARAAVPEGVAPTHAAMHVEDVLALEPDEAQEPPASTKAHGDDDAQVIQDEKDAQKRSDAS